MKRKMLLVFLGLVLVVSGLSAIDDEELSWNEKVWQVIRTLQENGASEALVEKVRQDMLIDYERNRLKEEPVLMEESRGNILGLEGADNTFYGYQAGLSITSGLYNSFFGSQAGKATTAGHRNNFFGASTGYKNTTGYNNMFFGHASGYTNTTGYKNMFLGYGSGNKNTTGYQNVAIGYISGLNNTLGFSNIFIGSEAGYSNTTADYNTFVGNEAGYSNVSGNYNTLIGNVAGRLSVGSYNTNIGHRAGENNTGNDNVFIGDWCGTNNPSGSGNVFIGNQAGSSLDASNKLVIDNSGTSNPLISGDFSTNHVGINNGSPGWMFVVGTSNAYCDGGAWVDGSSREVKENIEALTSAEALQAFARLEPVKFNYKQDKEEPRLGFIAEDVPELVAEKGRKGLSPMDMVAMLTKVVQEQQKTLTELQEKIAKLEGK